MNPAFRDQETFGKSVNNWQEAAGGAGVFSSTSGWTMIVVAERRRAAIVLKLEGVAVDQTRLRRFAARVLDSP